MAFLKRKTVIALLFVLAVLVGLGMSYLPMLVAKTVKGKKALEIKAVDYHSALEFSLADETKFDELANYFADPIFTQGYDRLNIILTDSEQPQKIYWMNTKNKLVNHLGFDVQNNGKSLDVYLYNNWSALADSGWDSEKIQREDELLLIRALLTYRGVKGKVLEDQIKEIYLIINKAYPKPLFYLTYAM